MPAAKGSARTPLKPKVVLRLLVIPAVVEYQWYCVGLGADMRRNEKSTMRNMLIQCQTLQKSLAASHLSKPATKSPS